MFCVVENMVEFEGKKRNGRVKKNNNKKSFRVELECYAGCQTLDDKVKSYIVEIN